jgi:methionine-rich copper-binding protein CopC
VVLTSSDPADGSALASAPSEIELTFSATPDTGLSHVSARDSSGAEITSGTLHRANGDGVRQPVSIGAAGNYTLAYHVEFTDGSDVTGFLSFSVGTGVPPPVPDAATVRAQRAVVSQHTHDVDPLSATLLVLDGAVLVGVIVLLRLRPAPHRSLDSPDEDQPAKIS